ncbi:endolytic transglycosylase MltG [Marisediminicola sp. LYQ134]|uniref:endolytic transglycosylase MltG n=1 Tax=Marisediminicola sp. LYQ134 TaxID=3391061 RepID=UPI003982FEC1
MPRDPEWDDLFSSQPGPADANAEGAPGSGAVDTGDAGRAKRSPRSESLLKRGEVTPPPTASRSRRAPRERRARDNSSATASTSTLASPTRSRRRSLAWLWIPLAMLLVTGLGATAAFFAFEPQVREVLGWEEPNDYTGEGTGEVVVAITEGQVGSDIAQTLADADVTMSYDAFYDLLLADPSISFQIGSYTLKSKMSADAALEALQDPDNRIVVEALFQEGLSTDQILETLAESTGIPLADFEAAVADPTAYGISAEAPNIEGYLFPASYTFEPGLTATDIITVLVDRTFQSLDAASVAPDDRHRVLTIASLIQREAGSNPDDFYKVSRVIQNRLDVDMPLQFDSTSHYGYADAYGERQDQSVFTSDAERGDDNPYNTYVITGLPVGPIGAPGDLAIDAAIDPVDGPWVYFVTVNLDTGETVFTSTLDEHNTAVNQLQAWCAETQSPNCA